jgi:tol-pal system protein YbgF
MGAKTPRLAAGAVACCAIAAALAAGWPAPVAAQLFADDQARRAILDVRGRVEELQRDLGRRMDQLELRVERVERASRGQLENQSEIQELRQEIASLRGQIEVLTHELSRTQRAQRDLVGEIDNRLKRVEPVPVTIDGQQHNVEVAERRAFEAALALFRSGDFRNAASALQQFIIGYPQSPYLPGAQYWLGSSQYALKDLKGSVQTLRAFLNGNPEHPMVPDALLTMGNAMADAGERIGASDVYERIITLHDGTPAAQTARQRLAALKTAAAAPAAAAPAAAATPAKPAATSAPRPGTTSPAPASKSR